MRAYLVTATVPAGKDESETEQPLKGYAGSQGDAAAMKKEWLESHDRLKRSAVRIDPVEIPTDKASLVPWLNKNAV